MRSIVQITIAKPERIHGGISIPMSLQVSDDDSEDEDLPEFQTVSQKLLLNDATLNEGREFIRDTVMRILDDSRTDFTAAGFERMTMSFEKYLEKNDVSLLRQPFIPDPASPTRH